jgi:predicted regulator of Ras-like GTPase activity (Roadblock/LC7/MglB family)
MGGCQKMAKKTKVEELTDLLKDLEATTPDIEASAVVSVDGLMIASALPQDVEEDRVAAMSAAMPSLGERTASELARGGLSEVYVKGKDGYVVLMTSGENAVLTALARKDAKLGLIFLDMKRTAEEVAGLV